eukprot:20924-Heterococcus_DN1.PRE.1
MQQASAYALKGSIRGIRDRDSTAEAVVLPFGSWQRGDQTNNNNNIILDIRSTQSDLFNFILLDAMRAAPVAHTAQIAGTVSLLVIQHDVLSKHLAPV